MEQQLNEKLLFNAPQQLKHIKLHVMLSFNMNHHKYVLFVSFNVLVLLKKVHKHTFNVMEQFFWILNHWCNKHVLLVLLKIL
jgi:hypothetical protein